MSSLHETETPTLSFSDMGLAAPLLKAINDAGYEIPTPIQQEMIPHMLAGKDVVGQAQTGTGKTAAFALPLLTRLQPDKTRSPQILVLAPTRELAIQVAEAFETYGKHMRDLRVLPIFGGQDYTIQLKQLQRGVQVVVGTPGRVMDHIRRGTLKTETIHSLILDEADEMLKMGFLEDVKWILEQLPGRKQTALFSATMPKTIRDIAQKYLSNPVEVTIRSKTVSAQTVNQRCLITNGLAAKLNTLSRILEAETFDGMLIFVRTKIQTVELAEQLAALGYSVAPLNGDIQQSQRLRTVEQLKSKKIDILVATDVAARGLDVERISHVINYDIPFDAEAYIHRIGRTGRAGRSGEAILFINGRERSMLKSIEQTTRQKIQMADLPSTTAINKKRIDNFKEKITTALKSDTSIYQTLVNEYLQENTVKPEQLAAALALLAQGSRPLLLEEQKVPETSVREQRYSAGPRPKARTGAGSRSSNIQLPPEEGMERFRIELGSEQGIKPANIVGAIANEADINSRHIGRISIYDSYSTVDLPVGMPDDILHVLQKSRVGSKTMRIQRIGAGIETPQPPARRQKPERERYNAGSTAKASTAKARKKPVYSAPVI
ncbi:MAG: DEAD/DEAH box helicase [Proteobacteria bacterium]|nr:DEAD/DEAH box helicase [Pseudomonadota bacterium]